MFANLRFKFVFFATLSYAITSIYFLNPITDGDYYHYVDACHTASFVLCNFYYPIALYINSNPYFLAYLSLLVITLFPLKNYLSIAFSTFSVFIVCFLQMQALKSCVATILMYWPLSLILCKRGLSNTSMSITQRAIKTLLLFVIILLSLEVHYTSILALLVAFSATYYLRFINKMRSRAPSPPLLYRSIFIHNKHKSIMISILFGFLFYFAFNYWTFLSAEILYAYNKLLIYYQIYFTNNLIAISPSSFLRSSLIVLIILIVMLLSLSFEDTFHNRVLVAFVLSFPLGILSASINRIYWFFLPFFIQSVCLSFASLRSSSPNRISLSSLSSFLLLAALILSKINHFLI